MPNEKIAEGVECGGRESRPAGNDVDPQNFCSAHSTRNAAAAGCRAGGKTAAAVGEVLRRHVVAERRERATGLCEVEDHGIRADDGPGASVHR